MCAFFAPVLRQAVRRLHLQYDEANKQVAILCNHQKGVSKSFDASMGKLQEKKAALQAEMADTKGPALAKLRCVAPLASLRQWCMR